jgi:hypothetical protein
MSERSRPFHPNTQRRPWEWTCAIWALCAIAILCEAMLMRGFLLAAAADSAAFTGRLGPHDFADVSYGLLGMVTAWTRGVFHPSHLEAWERSSFPISGLAICAFALVFHLRKRRPGSFR